jgi:hypothetical protein
VVSQADDGTWDNAGVDERTDRLNEWFGPRPTLPPDDRRSEVDDAAVEVDVGVIDP